MPTIREILAGYQEANEREREELCHRLPRLTVESLRQYLRMCALARRTAPDLERSFAKQHKMYYIQLHERLERAARGMRNGSAR